jgi:hypothetical protein
MRGAKRRLLEVSDKNKNDELDVKHMTSYSLSIPIPIPPEDDDEHLSSTDSELSAELSKLSILLLDKSLSESKDAPEISNNNKEEDESVDELNLSREQHQVLATFSKPPEKITPDASLSMSTSSSSLPPRPVLICIQEPPDDDDESTSTTDDCSSSHQHVGFSTVEIREYPIQIGDNPSVTRGVPITIGWDHCSSYKLNLDDFELVRPARRLKLQLKMESLDRIRMLKAMGYSRQDIQQEVRKVNVDRGRRLRTRETLNLAHMEEFFERIRRALLNATVRRRQKRRERELLVDYVSKDDTVKTVSTRSNQSSLHSVNRTGRVFARNASASSSSSRDLLRCTYWTHIPK